MTKLFLSILFFMLSIFCLGQNIFYQNIFKGGVIVKAVGRESSTISLPLQPNDSISKAFFISTGAFEYYRVPFYINNTEVIWDSTNQVGDFFYAEVTNPFSPVPRIHAIDITNLLHPTDTNIHINIPFHNLIPPNTTNLNFRYSYFTLYVEYQNNNNTTIASSLIVNETDATDTMIYPITSLSKINNYYPVSLSISYGTLAPGSIEDGSFVYVNNDSLGLASGYECCVMNTMDRVIGQYHYRNNTIYGIGDDTGDSLINGTDALADIKSYVNMGDTSIVVKSLYESPQRPNASTSNPIWAMFLTYSTKCDTLHSFVNIADTTICQGEPLQLQVGGDSTYTYAWRYRGEVVSTSNTININPMQGKIYSILVSDTNGCSKTEIINIKVNKNPSFVAKVTPATCPNANGAIVLDSVQGVAPPYWFSKNNGAWQTPPVYGYLPSGTYSIQIKDSNNCMASQNIVVPEVNNTIADFSYNSPLPYVPTEVVFTNQSNNATQYYWWVNGTLIDSTQNLTQWIEQEGDYTITLVASQNNQCLDTISKTITLRREQYFYIPSLNSGELTLFSSGYQLVSFSLVNALGQVVLQKEIVITSNQQNIASHPKLAKGVYFYTAKATDNNGTVVWFSGRVVV